MDLPASHLVVVANPRDGTIQKKPAAVPRSSPAGAVPRAPGEEHLGARRNGQAPNVPPRGPVLPPHVHFPSPVEELEADAHPQALHRSILLNVVDGLEGRLQAGGAFRGWIKMDRSRIAGGGSAHEGGIELL